MFAERGYGATTREIAERAGVSHELIFRYFDSKEKLFFEAVLNPLLDTVDELNRQWLAESSDDERTNEQFVRQFAMTFYDFLAENRAIAQAMMRLMTESSNDWEVEHMRQRIATTLESMVASLEKVAVNDKQVLNPGLQMRAVLLLIGTMASVLPYTYPSDGDVPGRDEIFAVLLESFESMWGLANADRHTSRVRTSRRR